MNFELPYNQFGKRLTQTAILFIGGDHDDKDTYSEILQRISDETNLTVFSFTPRNYVFPIRELAETKEDILEFIDFIFSTLNIQQLFLICTSSGAIMNSYALLNKSFKDKIIASLFLDPADYYFEQDKALYKEISWSGSDKYLPEFTTFSQKLSEINTDSKIDIVFFSIRNCEENSYLPMSLRGVDNPGKNTRMNRDMAKSFFNNLPEKNQGIYKENNKIPHAFERDGDIESNRKERMNEIVNFIKRNI